MSSDKDLEAAINASDANRMIAALRAGADPNLAVDGIAAPPVVLPGQPAAISWTTQNHGAAEVDGHWAETVYYASDDQIGNDTILATFEREGEIAAGEGIDRSEIVPLPRFVFDDFRRLLFRSRRFLVGPCSLTNGEQNFATPL